MFDRGILDEGDVSGRCSARARGASIEYPSLSTSAVRKPTIGYRPLRMIFMTWVKICGITNLEDAQTAVDAGADALGFVFYEKSPRYVTPSTVRKIVQQVPAQVAKVGVFGAGHTRDYLSIIQEAGLTASEITLRVT